MTAVEWLYDNLKSHFQYDGDLLEVVQFSFEQAKEMEKQQIIEAGNTCAIKQHIHIEKVNKMTMDEMLEFANTQTVTIGEEYYNETFNLSPQDKP
jgi:hypothetical protein